jgi:hypothetical protein
VWYQLGGGRKKNEKSKKKKVESKEWRVGRRK